MSRADAVIELATPLLAEVKALLPTVTELSELSGLWGIIAAIEKRLGNAEGVRAAIAQCAAVARRAPESDRRGPKPIVLVMAAKTAHDLGEKTLTRQLLAEACQIAQKIRDPEQRLIMILWSASGAAITGDATSARQRVALARRLSPKAADSDDANHFGASIPAMLGDFAAAKKMVAKLGKDPGNQALAVANVAEWQRRRGDKAGAKKTLGEALAVQGRIADTTMRPMILGRLLQEMVRQGDLAGATKRAGSDPRLRAEIAEALFDLDRPDEARKFSLKPGVDHATALARVGKAEEAKKVFEAMLAEHAYSMQDDPLRVLAAITAAQARAGDLDAARATIEEARKQVVVDPVFGDKRALLLARFIECLFTGGRRPES